MDIFSYRNDNISSIYIDGVDIENVNSFKYLGFNIDPRLSHEFHIRCITSILVDSRIYQDV